MREELASALTQAQKRQDKTHTATLRLIKAAITDRDIGNRGQGKDPVKDDEIAQIMVKMVKQREESARIYEEGNRPELAAQERQEIEIIRSFLPKQLGADETRKAVEEVIAEVGAEGLRDMGKCMAVLKERFSGRLDMAKASEIIKSTLK